MKRTTGRTPGVSLEQVFLKAAGELPRSDERSEVVAEALAHLQRGFNSHYGTNLAGDRRATDEGILVGDNAYAWAVETIARLDEPRFVAVASRMIRDGAGHIASDGNVSLEFWSPHLGDLLGIISGEDAETSRARILRAADELGGEGS
ncbi:MAG: hypothetical protein ACR2HO_05040 [Rubrobacteraceae bacterium]